MAEIELKPKDKSRRQKFEPGYIFSINMHNGKFGFGRCISKVSIGHIVEIFNYISKDQEFTTKTTENRMFDPIPIDSYSLIRTSREGDWTVIGKTDNYQPTNIEDIKYTYGSGPKRKLVDIKGNITEISENESKRYPYYSPKGDLDVIEMINNSISK